ncbi:hypothetical protein MTO96_006634 [Rhipicephalus appendiculatus]
MPARTHRSPGRVPAASLRWAGAAGKAAAVPRAAFFLSRNMPRIWRPVPVGNRERAPLPLSSRLSGHRYLECTAANLPDVIVLSSAPVFVRGRELKKLIKRDCVP